MTEEKKMLYRELLHWAMIDMRMHSSSASSNPLLLVLQRRRNQREVLWFINSIVNWLHNTALYATVDFVGFEEPLFWEDYYRFRVLFPATRWAGLTESVITELQALDK